MKRIRNKKFFIITLVTTSIFCATTILLPIVSFVIKNNDKSVESDKNNELKPEPNPGDGDSGGENKPEVKPDPTPEPEPEPNPPNPEPDPEVKPDPPTDNKNITSLTILNDSKLIEKYLINNRVSDVKNHFENMNSKTSLNDIFDKFNNVLFKMPYKLDFINQVQRILFRCDILNSDSYKLTYEIQLKENYVFEGNANKKQFIINFDYLQFVPPSLTPPDSDFKTINEAFDKIGGYDGQKAYSLSFPLLTNANSLGNQEKNKQLITNFINRYDKLNILDFLIRQEFIYQFMSFVFSNFNENIYDWQFYVDSFQFNKISIAFNLKNDVTIETWKNNIFGSSLSKKTFSRNESYSVTVSYKERDLVNPWKMTSSDFVMNKVWYDNNGYQKIISNAPQVSIPFSSLDFMANKTSLATISRGNLITTPYTMFWDFIEKDSNIFNRPSNAIDLDENSFGLAPTQIIMGNSNNLNLDLLPFDFDVQYDRQDISKANSLIERAFKNFDYNMNYEILSQLRYFVNYNFNGLFTKEDTYKIEEQNKIIYESQIKLESDREQGLFFKLYPESWSQKYLFKKGDVVKVKIEGLSPSYGRLDNPGFYYLGYDWNVISNPLNYDGSLIKNYLDEKRFPPTKLNDRKNVTLSSQLSLGDFYLSVSVIRNGATNTIRNWGKFVLRNVSLSMPISYNYYIQRKTN